LIKCNEGKRWMGRELQEGGGGGGGLKEQRWMGKRGRGGGERQRCWQEIGKLLLTGHRQEIIHSTSAISVCVCACLYAFEWGREWGKKSSLEVKTLAKH